MRDPALALSAAGAKLTKARALNPDHARAHAWLGDVFAVSKHGQEGIAQCERALFARSEPGRRPCLDRKRQNSDR